MSNFRAIATVTTALAQLVNTAALSAVDSAGVLNERPDSTPLNEARVRLFLYQVTPNAALRNSDLPGRSADGKLVQRPVAALDLHYLLAFYGDEKVLEPQRMLGAVVRDLHAQPILTRAQIQAVVSQPFLTESNLADAVEQVKLTQLPLTLDDLAKIWSVFFQTPYALSLAYQASVVLIESEETAQPGLPVLQRGQQDQGVDTVLGPFPALDTLHIGELENDRLRLRQPSYPSARLGVRLTLRGKNLGGETRSLRFTHQRLGTALNIPVTGNANEIMFTVPKTGDVGASDWAAGLYSVAVVVTSGGRERTTNALPFSFAPKITEVSAGLRVSNQVTLTVTCEPAVHPEQRVELALPDREVRATSHPVVTNTPTFELTAPPAGEVAVRLRVDGVDHLPFKLVDDKKLELEHAKVTIP